MKEPNKRPGWIGVDFDGTLATYHGWKEPGNGQPVPSMVARVKNWLADGIEVRIVTARVSDSHTPDEITEQARYVGEWCEQNIGQRLRITCSKDHHMIELWDDRAVTVERNTGRVQL